MKKRKSKMKGKDKKIIAICIFIIILCLIGLYYYYFIYLKSDSKKVNKVDKKLTIVDQDSNKRPIAVMYDNNVGYDKQAGLQDSYLNYEIIVEGGLTRIMALFKDKDVSLIGPVRSSRHYFLDYSAESDAIYCHYGWSEFAKHDISSLGIDNINGLTNENAYYRDNSIAKPHNVFTSTERIYNQAKKLDYNLTTKSWQLLNYSLKDINLDKTQYNDAESADSSLIVANNLSLKYSNYQTTSYQYDSEHKYYLRYMDGKAHVDKSTGNQLHYKNIIVQTVKNTNLDSYGRQDLDTVSSGSGYYMTNGYALPISFEKQSRTGKTIYTYEDGTEVRVNDGNTFIQIIPVTTTPEFS